MKGRAFIQVVLIALAALLVSDDSARAGTMYVYSCHTPNGAPAGTAGWRHTTAPSRAWASNDCTSGPNGVLFAQSIGGDGNSSPPVWSVSWTFAAAPDTAITGFASAVCPQVTSGAVTVSWGRGPFTRPEDELRRWPDASPVSSTMFCHGSPPYWADARNVVQRHGLRVPEISFVAGCYMCLSLSTRGTVEVSSFRADIRDDYAPVITSVRGPLASNFSHAGTERVEFDVSDVGVGVYRAVVEARLLGQGSWLQLATAPLGSGRASCAELNVASHPYEFDDPQPCPLNVSGAQVDFDTDSIPAGEHELRVVVEDASGNRTHVVTPRKFLARGPAGAAAPALIAAGRTSVLRINGAARRTVPAGETFRVRGRLTEIDGKPLNGIAITVRTRGLLPKPSLPAGDWTVLGQVVTAADGTFSARIPKGASRTVQFLRESGDGLAAVAAQADMIVPASVIARARATRIRNGQSAVITGRVQGRIPSGGVLVALEVREPGRWIPVATTRRWVRTNAEGRFRLAYRFRRTFEPSTYRFRVAAIEDSAFAYSRGVSRTIDVRVKP